MVFNKTIHSKAVFKSIPKKWNTAVVLELFRRRKNTSSRARKKKILAKINQIRLDQEIWRIRRVSQSKNPQAERLLYFWLNHFSVSTKKLMVAGFGASYEIQAIAPNIYGRFSELLVSAVQHPAMLFYLDNHRSKGPNTGINKNINENLAREILELHTLGVDGGYHHSDITELANAITGWSVPISGFDRLLTPDSVSFVFKNRDHEPGRRKVLNKVYASDDYQLGVDILNDLSVHPSTRKFICQKLIASIVGTSSSNELLLDEISSEYHSTNGNLLSVYKVLKQVCKQHSIKANKYKNAMEFLTSIYQLLPQLPSDAEIRTHLNELGQIPYQPPGPNGWTESEKVWGASDQLIRRFRVAKAIAEVYANEIDPLKMLNVIGANETENDISKTVHQAESPKQALAIIFSSPGFMRHPIRWWS